MWNIVFFVFVLLLTWDHLTPQTLKTSCFCMLLCEFVRADAGTRQQIKQSGTCMLPPNQFSKHSWKWPVVVYFFRFPCLCIVMYGLYGHDRGVNPEEIFLEFHDCKSTSWSNSLDLVSKVFMFITIWLYGNKCLWREIPSWQITPLDIVKYSSSR